MIDVFRMFLFTVVFMIAVTSIYFLAEFLINILTNKLSKIDVTDTDDGDIR